jgi:phage shock protein C
MYCNCCGKAIPDDAQLCAYCGVRVTGTVVARKRLVRPRNGRKIAGVCLGFAEYFDLDVSLIRVVWLVCILGGFGLLAYIVAWIVIPEEPLYLPAPAASSSNATNP